LEYKSAAYHRAAAERARKQRAEATTRWLKERLGNDITQHEQIAEEIERASEPSADDDDPVRKLETNVWDCLAAARSRQTATALFDDILNGNLATSVLVGVGALIAWLLLSPIGRTAANSLIKAGLIAPAPRRWFGRNYGP